MTFCGGRRIDRRCAVLSHSRREWCIALMPPYFFPFQCVLMTSWKLHWALAVCSTDAARGTRSTISEPWLRLSERSVDCRGSTWSGSGALGALYHGRALYREQLFLCTIFPYLAITSPLSPASTPYVLQRRSRPAVRVFLTLLRCRRRVQCTMAVHERWRSS